MSAILSRVRFRNAFVIITALLGVLVLWRCTKRNVSSARVPRDVRALIERGKQSIPEDIDRMEHATSLLHTLDDQFHTAQRRQGVLCVTFLSWTAANSAHLAKNILSLGEACHWLVLIYNNHGKDESEMRRDLSRDLRLEASNSSRNSSYVSSFLHSNESSFSSSGNNNSRDALDEKKITIIQAPERDNPVPEFRQLCEGYISAHDIPKSLANSSCAFIRDPPLDASAINHKLYPKVMMFLSVLPHVSLYKHVWLLDGDLYFEGFDFAKYLHIHQCAFESPPLVSQPAIFEGRPYKYLSSSYWKGSPYIASKLGFVEIMAPFMDAQFFEWFVMAFVVPMFSPMHVTAADWGFDNLFCKAALWYHQTRISNSTNVSLGSLSVNNDEANQCAVIISTPIHHADSKEIDKNVGKESKTKLFSVLVDAIAQHYRPLFWDGSAETKRIQRIYGNLFTLKGKYHGNIKGRVAATKLNCSVHT